MIEIAGGILLALFVLFVGSWVLIGFLHLVGWMRDELSAGEWATFAFLGIVGTILVTLS